MTNDSFRSRGQTAVTAVFMASLLTATFLGSKLILVGGMTFSLGLIIFPFTFIALETSTEVYGRGFANHLIRVGIGIQIYVLCLIALGSLLPESPLRSLDGAYGKMFGLAPRMILASVTAYAFSQFVDVSVFLKVGKATHGRHLWLRANAASYVSQAVDTVIFSLVFLGGVLPFSVLIRSASVAYLVKIGVGTLDTPLVYLGRRALRALDRKSGQSSLRVEALRTSIFKQGEDLAAFIVSAVPSRFVSEGMILAITSKIVSLAEGEVISSSGLNKLELIRREADIYLGETLFGVSLTIKHGILIPSAGIDESNSDGEKFILFPKDPYQSAKLLHSALKKAWKLDRLGILITDSHTHPLRRGVTGIGLSHWGFKATRNLVGKRDLFGREVKMTHVNVIDALAVSAVYAMGEVAEQRPLAILNDEGIEFTDSSSAEEISIPREEDLYGSLLFPETKTSRST
ncbi:MAG: queuosine precursor transporter [Cryobacterium sp.]|nr:queuosine precursor transporter [Oligoflexia bacterium]